MGATSDNPAPPPRTSRPSASNASATRAAIARVLAMSRLERIELALALGRRNAGLMRLRGVDDAR